MVVLAADHRRTNVELIRDVRRLKYLTNTQHVVDLTYGLGVWWKDWHPKHLTTYSGNFLSTGFQDGEFDVVIYDPPYVSPGGRSTSTVPNFNERYGLHATPKSPEELQLLINEGMQEASRILRPSRTARDNAFLMVKCMDYVSSGKLYPGTYRTLHHAFQLGFTLQDHFMCERSPGMQPKRRGKEARISPQQHARNNFSVLYVLRSPIERKKA